MRTPWGESDSVVGRFERLETGEMTLREILQDGLDHAQRVVANGDHEAEDYAYAYGLLVGTIKTALDTLGD